ncbi:hypothetical protein H5410_037500 [Solanum commersonii]|uniref:Uncharacterized protein n=1 Tax=Solanum commersonii TaxID=4109 RepID=A0A9J5YAE2_SOLCO|nr:hypothetical protein H5410_037500 [Solanum commersonii]
MDSFVAHEDSCVATEDSFVATEDEMIQEASSMTTAQSFIGVGSSSNIKCYFCLCEECEQPHDYFISRVKELTDIFKEMTYNIEVHTSKKISQPWKCRRFKKYISQSLSIISERKKLITSVPVSHSNSKGKEKEKGEDEKEKEQEKEREKEKEKEQEKEKEKEKVKKKAKEKEKKKVKVISCDVKQQYPFEDFNIDGEGPIELMSSFSRDKKDHYLANCSDLEFKQLDLVVAFSKKKDWFYVMSQPNKCWTDQRLWNFVTAYAKFLSDGLQVPSYGISSETLLMRYTQRNCVSNNEDPQRPRPKKAKFDENVMVTTIY